ncbi:disulfide-isomerase [Reticulomyxa filosa]|uniref:Protein disulfide-isomerase n=1 Tax=Reticulomyxa filosa TaxID=46433 RepID=X6NRX3_RETFI|nr:disulfide-isomerase [Reticulomyxa filosa]|eukprot:ETO28688.1 disulfide-isomerase [Reticulomyxa filosa]
MLRECLLIALFVSNVVIGDEFVKTLKTNDFNEVVSSSKRILVEFYAPWCGHCKALQPEYEKAAKRLNAEQAETILAKVDATEDRDLATKYSISGYPTLKYFVNGDLDNPQEYNGGRTEETIVSWVLKRELPAVTTLQESEVDNFKSKHKVSLVAYLKGDSSNPAVAAVYDVADSLREDVVIGLVQSLVKLYRQFDEPEATLEGEITTQRLKDFVQSERFALFDEISTDNYQKYVARGLPLVWVALEGSDSEQREHVATAIKDITKQWKGKLSFVWIDNAKFGQHVTNLGIKSPPGLVLVEGSNTKYLYDGDIFSSNDLKAWFDKYSKKEIPKFLKSQAKPETNNDAVLVLVEDERKIQTILGYKLNSTGSTFEEVVGKDSDVFVEFYAPWCGHCKRLAPDYDKVGEAFKDVKDFVIAKIDATENDTPEEIRGFPTLVFYPKGSLKGEKYTGGRTASEIIGWLKKKATVNVDGLKAEL